MTQQSTNQLEEGGTLTLDFDKITKAAAKCRGLIPVALQDADTNEVILLAYTNETAFKKAVTTRCVVLWSTSRNELWEKGATSGNTFELLDVLVNCEQNSLLYKVRPRVKGICHTKNKAGKPRNCFYRRLNLDTLGLDNLDA
ncbi:MAG: phosphoribosyl-AMP cyclohydrolase [bacterium]